MSIDQEVSGSHGSKSGLNGNSAMRAGEKAVNAFKEKEILASDAMDRVSERFNDILARSQAITKASAETVRKHPLYSVLGVASVAFLAGFILRKK